MNKSPLPLLGALLAIFFTLSTGVFAAQSQADIPSPPYVASVPDFFQWTMTISSTGSGEKDLPDQRGGHKPPPTISVQKVVSTKTKDTKRDVIYFSNGKSTEIWHYQDCILSKAANGDISVEPAGMGLAFLMPEWTAKSFVGVGWITADNFRGKQTYSTGDVYVYTGTLHPTAPQAPSFAASQGINAAPAPPPLDVPVMAMIAVDSRLPLIVEKGSQVITYSYQAPPVQMLEIPPEFQKPLSGLQTRLNFIEQLRNLH